MQLPSAPEDGVSGLAFRSAAGPSAASPAQREMLAASSWDGTVRVWDVEEGWAQQAGARLAHVFAAGSPALSVAWAGDGSGVLRGDCDGAISLLSLVAGASVQAVGRHAAGVSALRAGGDAADAPSAVFSASWDGSLCSWDLRAGPARAALSTAKLGCRALCADVRWPHAVVGLALPGSVLVFDLRRPAEPLRQEPLLEILKQAPRCVAIAPPGTMRAAGGEEGGFSFCVGTYEGKVAVQRSGGGAAQPSERYSFKAHCGAQRAHALNALSFCGQDGALLSAGSDGGLSLWDVRARSRLTQLPNQGQPVSCATFDRRGRGFAFAASYDWTGGEQGADPAKRPEVWLVNRQPQSA